MTASHGRRPDLLPPAQARRTAQATRERWSDPMLMECAGGCGTTARRSYRLAAVVSGKRPRWWCDDCAQLSLFPPAAAPQGQSP
ncbi:MAG: hypothetical protein OXJ62_16260 [Spirochaetaceae bacterium]|nr:hypothetical protein [Spirochaetaceae bacterium]